MNCNIEDWDVNDLPPIGCECLTQKEAFSKEWIECKILAHTEFGGLHCAVYQTKNAITCSSKGLFRPIKSEADKKRDDMVNSMVETMIYYYGNPKGAESYIGISERIIDAISIGKIPGVKLGD